MSDVFANGYAVVIGVDDNQIERFALPTVAKDVQAVYDVLIHPERCAYKEEHVRFVKGSESTRKNILDSLFWLQEQAEKDKNATAVVYYSGHGMEDKDAGQYYLIPYDIRSIGRLRADAIKAEELTAEISAIDAQRLLVILDCCHAAGMDVKDIDLEATRAPNIEAGAFPIDLPETKDVPEYTAEPGASKDVSDLLDGEGRAILNSSTGSQSSYIRKDGAMSLFTYHLIEALTGHAPHADDATVVYVTDVMSWVTHEVKKSAAREGRDQTPVMRTSGVFPVAQLIGGKGVAKGIGEVPPDPLAPLPEAGVSVQADTISDSNIAGRDVNISEGGINFGSGDVHIEGPVAGRDIGHVGDVVSGDKVGGDKISVGNISGSSGIAIGRGASATVTIQSMPDAGSSEKEQLNQLVAQLEALLNQAPASQQTAASNVAQTTQMLITNTSAENPDPAMVQTIGGMLRQAAQSFKDNLPQIVDLAGNIAAVAATIAKATGG
ncbi:MAG: caspase domain-containing protein [Candidatus Promineifilaceae bacterium]